MDKAKNELKSPAEAKVVLDRINRITKEALDAKEMLLGDIDYSDSGMVKMAFLVRIQNFKGPYKIKLNLLRQYISFDRKSLDLFEPYQMEPEKFKDYSFDPKLLIIAKETKALEKFLNQSSVNKRDEIGRPYLYIASVCGYNKIVQMLLKWGAVPYFTSSMVKSTPLHGASFFGHKKIVKLLLEVGAEIRVENQYGNSPYEEALSNEIREIMDEYEKDICFNLFQNFRVYMCSVKIIFDSKKYIGKRLQLSVTPIEEHWDLAWHGTKLSSIESILKYGLKRSGQISGKRTVMTRSQSITRLQSGHPKDEKSTSIFTSPSILYASHQIYAEHFKDFLGKDWVVILECRLRPGCYKIQKNKIKDYEKIKYEPEYLEFAINDEKNVKVSAVWFLQWDYLRNYKEEIKNYSILNDSLSEYYAEKCDDDVDIFNSLKLNPKEYLEIELNFLISLFDKFKGVFNLIQRQDKIFENNCIDSFFGLRFLIKNLEKEVWKWDLSWHGTKLKSIESIVANGLLKPGEVTNTGSQISVRSQSKIRIQEGVEIQEVKDWANAIFTSPSILYSACETYAEVFTNPSTQTEWALLLECRVKPTTYHSGGHTFYTYDTIENEPEDVEFRTEEAENVRVTAFWFIKKKFLDKYEDYDKLKEILINYIEA